MIHEVLPDYSLDSKITLSPHKGDSGQQKESAAVQKLHLVSQVDKTSPDGNGRAVIDVAIVERAVDGDVDAFTEIVNWYHPRFVRFARHMLQSDTDADDVVQDAFIRIYRALPLYNECARFESWIFRILANCCRTHLTRHQRQKIRLVSIDSYEALGVEAHIDSRDDIAWRDLLKSALDSLPIEQREAFLLHHIDGHSYEAMAEITGLGQSALKMRVKRACDRLRLLLGDTQDD